MLPVLAWYGNPPGIEQLCVRRADARLLSKVLPWLSNVVSRWLCCDTSPWEGAVLSLRKVMDEQASVMPYADMKLAKGNRVHMRACSSTHHMNAGVR
jgi:hypothetical protein